MSTASPALATEPAGETLETPWVGSGPGTVNVVSDGASSPAQMTYEMNPAGLETTQTWSFSATAGSTGTRDLRYEYRGFHSWFQVTAFLRAFVTHEGVTTYTPLVSEGPADCCSSPSNGFSYDGHVELDVQSGDTYGFEFGGSNDDINNDLQGTLTISPATPEPPLNTQPPEVNALHYLVGQQLTGTTGSWQSESGEVTYRYQWLRCNESGESCETIPGATTSSFVLEPNEVRWTLRLRVTARNSVGETSAESSATPVIPEIDWVGEAGLSGVETETATVSGWVELAAGPGGQQVYPDSEACAQWRRPGASSWSQQCVSLFVSVEFATGCFDEGVESVVCQLAIPIGGLEPGTEYESRFAVISHGEEVAASIMPFTTEGEGLPRASLGPQLSGDWMAGETMEVNSPGSWSGIEPFAYTEAWEICMTQAEECQVIPNSEAPAYVIPAEDVAKTGESPRTLRYRLTATNEHGQASELSEEHDVLAAPAAFTTAGPVLEGNVKEGEALTLSHYEIGGDPTPTVTYRWERCDGAGEECEEIGGANGPSYVLTSEDVGHTIRAVVHASNAEYVHGDEVSEETAQTSMVATASAGQPPMNTELPEVEAEPEYYVGEELLGSNGAWQSESGAITYTYQWLRCDAGGGSCEEITGATASIYEPTSADVMHTLRLRVTARNGAGEASAESAATPVIPEISGAATHAAEDVTAEAATLSGELELVAEPGDAVPLSAEGCVQWRHSGAGSWSEQCAAVEDSDCSPAAMEWLSCQTSIALSGLAPATEYEYRYVGLARGEEQAGAVSAFTTLRASGGTEEAPTATLGPALSGSGIAGETMEVTSPGVWAGAEPITYSYSWERCVEETHVCTPIPGAFAPSYSVPAQDVAKVTESPYALRASVTATNAYGHENALSAEHDVFAAPAAFATTEPLASGQAKEGATLTLTHYAIAGEPTPTVTYRWERCDSSGASCEEVSGAHGASYLLTSEDVGHTIRAVVRASNAEYLHGAEVSEETTQTALVTASTLECAPGSYSLTGIEPCSQAGPGHYAEGSGAIAEVPCPAGTHDGATGSTSSSACLPDPPGTYSSPGAATATPCVAGSYSDVTGAGVCTPASLGDYVASAGSAAQTPCPAGTYAEVTGSTSCTPTPPDTYSTGGAAKPTPCPAGTESPAGAAVCTTATESTPQSQATTAEPVGPSAETPTSQLARHTREPAPALTRLSVTHRCVAYALLAVGARGKRRRSGGGLAISFHLNEAARITYTVWRREDSPRLATCPTVKRASTGRYEKLWTGPTTRDHAGAGVLASALVGMRAQKLSPGTYMLTVTATDTEGEHSAPVSVNFWVLEKPRRGRR